jgi:hypothetical protein
MNFKNEDTENDHLGDQGRENILIGKGKGVDTDKRSAYGRPEKALS